MVGGQEGQNKYQLLTWQAAFSCSFLCRPLSSGSAGRILVWQRVEWHEGERKQPAHHPSPSSQARLALLPSTRIAPHRPPDTAR